LTGLFDFAFASDPREHRNLASDARQAETVRLLKAALARVPALEPALPRQPR
jgi:hypothetical protein